MSFDFNIRISEMFWNLCLSKRWKWCIELNDRQFIVRHFSRIVCFGAKKHSTHSNFNINIQSSNIVQTSHSQCFESILLVFICIISIWDSKMYWNAFVRVCTAHTHCTLHRVDLNKPFRLSFDAILYDDIHKVLKSLLNVDPLYYYPIHRPFPLLHKQYCNYTFWN